MYPHKGYPLCARCQGFWTKPKTSLLRQILNEKTEDAVPVTVKKEVCEPLRGPEPPISVLVSVVKEALGCMVIDTACQKFVTALNASELASLKVPSSLG